MARTRNAIIQDLRNTQKQLLTAKVRRNYQDISHCRALLAELQREYNATI